MTAKKTKDIITTRALDLFMKYGIRSITMNEIASQIGMSKKTLYEHYDSKNDLVAAALQERLRIDQEMCESCQKNATDAIDEMFHITKYVVSMLREMSPSVLYDLKKYYPENWRQMEEFHYGYIQGMSYANLETGIREGLYRDDLDIDIISKFYVSKIWIIVDEKHFSLNDYRRDILFKEHIFYHLHGIVSQEGWKRLQSLKKEIKTQ